MKNNEKFSFVQPDLLALYYNGDFTRTFYHHSGSEYHIIVVNKGKIKIEYPDKIVYLKPGDTFIANKSECYSFKTTSKNIEYFEIRFTGKFFHEIDPKIDIIKPFSYTNKDKIKIYNEETKTELYSAAVKSVIRSLKTQSSRAIMLSAVLQLICELYYIYNQKNPPKSLETESNFAKLYKYIDDHLFEKITLKSVSEGTFLSPRNISYIMRKITDKTFHEFITDRRLEFAKSMIKTYSYNMREVAINSGFDSYTTFYRTFTNKFGLSPNEYKKQIKNAVE